MTQSRPASRRAAVVAVLAALVVVAGCGSTGLSTGRVLPPASFKAPSPSLAPAHTSAPASPTAKTVGATTLPPQTVPADTVPATTVPATARPPATVNLSGASTPVALPAPTGLVIPAIGVNTSVVPLGLNPDGTAAVPTGFTFAGWYDLGPRPGQLGPAVILGHVDSTTGPAVFFRLKSLLPGDKVTVEDGAVSVSFEVQRLVTYAKDQFPTATVFGPTPDAELRLITCGGPFDRSIGHYEDNIVVYAVRIG